MNRELRTAGLGLLAVAAAGCAPKQETRPNIILVLADDMGPNVSDATEAPVTTLRTSTRWPNGPSATKTCTRHRSAPRRACS